MHIQIIFKESYKVNPYIYASLTKAKNAMEAKYTLCNDTYPTMQLNFKVISITPCINKEC